MCSWWESIYTGGIEKRKEKNLFFPQTFCYPVAAMDEPTQTPTSVCIELFSGNKESELFEALEHVHSDHICFYSEEKVGMLLSSRLLKKLHAWAEEQSKTLSFVLTKKSFSLLFRALGYSTLPEIPDDLKDVPRVTLSELLGRMPAQKNDDTSSDTRATENPPEGETPPDTPGKATDFQRNPIEPLREGKPLGGVYFFFSLLFIGLLGGVYALISPQATITISPKVSLLPVTQNVIVATAQATVPEEEKSLAVVDAILVETEFELSEAFPTTLREYELTNARGKITIFNESSEPKFFIPSRVATKEGITFWTQDEITIPPRTPDGPGAVVVEVEAAEFDAQGRPIGYRGNIDAGTELSFPALRQETRALYPAVADQGPLVGGSTLTRYFVTADDFPLAQEQIQQTFLIRGRELLRQEIQKRGQREGREYRIMDDPRLIQVELQDITFPEGDIGKEQETFTVKARAKVRGLSFDQSQVLEVLQQEMQRNKDHRNRVIDINRDSITYDILQFDQLESEGWIKVSTSISGVQILDILADNTFAAAWREEIKREIAGKTIDEVRGLLTNHPEIEDVLTLRVQPFWAQSIPSILDQIEFRIQEEFEMTRP